MLNVALCSYGMSGKVFHAPLVTAEPQLNLHTIVQRGEPSALLQYPDVQIASNVTAVLDDPRIDIVVVNTPNEHHYPMTKAALLAGKHVVVEKPFTLNVEQGQELIELAKQQQKVLAVFQNKRLESDHLAVTDIVNSGVLGRIVEVEWHYDRYRTHITHKKWKEDNLPGAGTWFDLGIHMVDSVLCIFGKPKAVFADMRSLRSKSGATDFFNVLLQYDDLRVLLRSNTFVSEKGATVMLHGDQGSFLKYGQDVQEAQMMRGIIPGMEGWAIPGADNMGHLSYWQGDQLVREQKPGPIGCYQNFYRNVVDAITGIKPLEFSAEKSSVGVEVLLAAEQSASEGCWVAMG